MSLTAEKELAIRTSLGEKVAAITNSVFIRRPLFDSKQDWTEGLGHVNIDGETEIRACTVDLYSFTDSPTEGCDDDPVVTLTYGVHLFHQYQESRTDESNSTDDFNAAVLDLRNTFLQGSRDVAGAAGSEYLPLVQSGFIILDDDPLTGAFGHYVDLQAQVEVR